jgi:PAS domain-containing protein
VLSLGFLLARCDRGEMALLASDGQGGLVLRRLLPVALGMPVALAAITLAGDRLGLFTATVGGWLFASAMTITFAALGWVIAGAAERADGERRRVEGRDAAPAQGRHGHRRAVDDLSVAGRRAATRCHRHRNRPDRAQACGASPGQALADLRDAEERFRSAFDEAPIGMALISEDGRLEQANSALGVICG